MSSGTILSFLAQKHVTQREVVASDGLAFLLQRSHPALAGASHLLGLNRDDAIVEGQFVDGESRPDVAFLDPTTRKPLALLELKFWAALTAAQPAEYLRMLDEAGGGSLCFVAPSARHAALWKELLDRAPGFISSTTSKFFATRGSTTLKLISWEELLAPIAAAVGGTPLLADLDQLRGLIRDFESAEFRPFQSEDISNLETPRLVMALSGLADAVAKQAELDGTVSIGKLRPTHGWRFAGRYLMLAQRAGAWFGMSHYYWARFGLSPLWLEFSGGAKWDPWTARPLVRKACADILGGALPTAFEIDGNLVVAVPLPLQVERDAAVREVARWLGTFGKRLIDAGLPVSRGTPSEAEQQLNSL